VAVTSLGAEMHKRILIVDDSKIVRQLVRTHLEARLPSVACSEAVDGTDAVQRAKEWEPDLILLDFFMPRMNGMDAAVILHAMLPQAPIILYTLHKDKILENRARSAGICCVVSKTDPIDVLLLEVTTLMGIARSATA